MAKETKISFWKIMQKSILGFGFPMMIFYFLMMVFFGALDEGLYTLSELLFFGFQLGVWSGIAFGLIMWLIFLIKNKKSNKK
ncbi:hypothetical protein AUJ84_02495 [Candidatus Pacearchaeota archaeon CG1_02_32_132]|nr:MAG: hypothetical protein AUJ84_02495 [Candidatus Pacearchaeota archaeon CG1_02_32_132]